MGVYLALPTLSFMSLEMGVGSRALQHPHSVLVLSCRGMMKQTPASSPKVQGDRKWDVTSGKVGRLGHRRAGKPPLCRASRRLHIITGKGSRS